MKKSLKKIVMLMLTLLVTMTMSIVPVFAADASSSKSADGLLVVMTTDQSSYTSRDKINVTLTVTNKNSTDVTGVTLEDVIPQGYSIGKGKSAVKSVDTLKAGETVKLEVTLIPNSTSLNGKPKTGDTITTVLWVIALIAAAAAIVFCIVLLIKGKRKNRGARMMSLLLVLALTFAMLPAITAEKVSAQENTNTINVNTTVTVDGKSLVLYGNVFYHDIAATTEVTISSISADPSYIPAGETTKVRFTAAVTGSPECVYLYNGNGRQITALYDNGSNGDAQAADGIYSAYVNFTPNEAGRESFYIGLDTVKSDSLVMTYYSEREEDNTYTGSIAGNVYDASTGKAISNVYISFYDGNTRIQQYVMSSSDKGHYSVSLPAGTYYMTVRADGYITADATVTIRDNETTYMENLLLSPYETATLGVVSGTVKDAQNAEGVANAQVTIRDGWNNTTGTVIASTATAADGSYLLNLAAGNYTVQASKDGYIYGTVNIMVQNGATTSNANITISQVMDSDTYRIVLTWGGNPKDIDSHVYGTLSNGNSMHVYYSSKNAKDNGVQVCNLDVDDTTGYGPETVTLTPDVSSPYYYYIYKYNGTGDLKDSNACVNVYQGSNLIATYYVPTDQGSGRYWNVFAIVNGTLVSQNTVTSNPDREYANDLTPQDTETTETQTTETQTTETQTTETLTTETEINESQTTETQTTETQTAEEEVTEVQTTETESTEPETTALEGPDDQTQEEASEPEVTNEEPVSDTPETMDADQTQEETEAAVEATETEEGEDMDEVSYAGELEAIQERGVLRIGVASEDEIDADGIYVGDNEGYVQLQYILAEDLGVEVEFVPYITSDSEGEEIDSAEISLGLYEMLQNEEIDMIFDGLDYSTFTDDMEMTLVYVNNFDRPVTEAPVIETISPADAAAEVETYGEGFFIGLHLDTDLTTEIYSAIGAYFV